MAFVLFDASALPTPERVIAVAAAMRPDLGISTLGAGAEATFMLRAAGQIFVLMAINQPMPAGELAEAARAAWWWPEATSALKRQRQHVILAQMGEATDDASQWRAAQALTVLSAALVQAGPGALGVQWTASGVVQPAARMAVLAALEMPLDLWLHVNLRADADGVPGIVVRGLAAFAGRDLVMAPSRAMPPAELAQRAVDVSAYLISSGVALGNGETVGISPTERIRVRFADDPATEGPVYELTVEHAA